jgi:CheY-like chemotaxis protein
MENLCVLIVEDDDSQINYLSNILKKVKIRVIAASSGEQALELIKGKKIDLALLDINLGKGMDGIKLMKTMKAFAEYSKTPFVAVTAYYNRDYYIDRDYFIDEGFSDFIPKPFRFDQIITVIKDNIVDELKINSTHLIDNYKVF